MSSYGEPEIQRGLIAIAYAGGNYTRASRDLKEDGITINPSTLRRWAVEQYPDRYADVRRKVLPQIQAAMAQEHTALAHRQTEVAAALVDELDQERAQLEPRDKINALAKMDIGSGIHSEKGLLYDGQPTSITQGKSVEELLRGLKARGLFLEGEVAGEEDVTPPKQELPA